MCLFSLIVVGVDLGACCLKAKKQMKFTQLATNYKAGASAGESTKVEVSETAPPNRGPGRRPGPGRPPGRKRKAPASDGDEDVGDAGSGKGKGRKRVKDETGTGTTCGTEVMLEGPKKTAKREEGKSDDACRAGTGRRGKGSKKGQGDVGSAGAAAGRKAAAGGLAGKTKRKKDSVEAAPKAKAIVKGEVTDGSPRRAKMDDSKGGALKGPAKVPRKAIKTEVAESTTGERNSPVKAKSKATKSRVGRGVKIVDDESGTNASGSVQKVEIPAASSPNHSFSARHAAVLAKAAAREALEAEKDATEAAAAAARQRVRSLARRRNSQRATALATATTLPAFPGFFDSLDAGDGPGVKGAPGTASPATATVAVTTQNDGKIPPICLVSTESSGCAGGGVNDKADGDGGNGGCVGGGDRWVELGFGDHSWTWGPWYRYFPESTVLRRKKAKSSITARNALKALPERSGLSKPFGSEAAGDVVVDNAMGAGGGEMLPQHQAKSAEIGRGLGGSGGVAEEDDFDDEGWEAEEEIEEEATREAMAKVAGKGKAAAMAELGRRSRMYRANVGIGEFVALGEDEAYREWLLRLRKIQVIGWLLDKYRDASRNEMRV